MSKSVDIVYVGNKLSRHGFTPTTIESLAPKLQQEGHTIFCVSEKRPKLPRLFDMLHTIWRNRKTADVVLVDTYSTQAFYFAWFSAFLCRLLKIKYVPILHGGKLPQRLKSSPAMCKAMFGNSFTNVAVSPFLRKCFADAGYKTTLIPNNIDIQTYPLVQRREIQPRLLWVRSFHAIYNPLMAVRVLDGLLKKHPDATMSMVGPDKDGSMEHCKSLSAKLGIENKIKFFGKLRKEEWIKLSENHDIFINTSDVDNLPLTLIEAMALGMPVVSTNVGGIPELIEHEYNGYLVSKNDDQGMCSAIEELITDAKMVAHLSANGRSTAANYDWDTVKHQWDSLFSTLPIK